MASSGGEKRVKPRKLAPKSPARGSSPGSSKDEVPRSSAKPKRAQVKAACLSCQKGKNKCDGVRPQCTKCTQKGRKCEYDVEPDTSRSESMRRKYEALYGEYEQLRKLVEDLHSRPSVEAAELFRRLRYENNPIDVARSLNENKPELHESLAKAGVETPAQGIGLLDLDAWNASVIKVRAKPWTLMAGDGIVSELISAFFAYDNVFYCPFVDRECFLEDMTSGDSDQAMFCSPLLVNAICALRSSTSERARLFGQVSGFNTRDQFLSEAKRLLDREFGRRSLQTVQALLIMYACMAGMGKDRAGAIYRYAAYEMLRRLKLEAKYRDIAFRDEAKRAKYQKALSRALWGICCFESISAFLYLQPAMVRVPDVPRRFVDDGGVDPEVIGQSAATQEPHVCAYVFNAFCDLSELLYAIMDWNEKQRSNLGEGLDIETRISFYQELEEWSRSLSPLIQADSNFTLATCFLSTYENLIALSIFRPLDPSLRLPRGYGTPALICLRHCQRNVESSEKYWKHWPSSDYSILSVYPLYNCAITLVHMLQDHHSHDLFGRTCSLLARHKNDFPFVTTVLQGLNSIMHCVGTPMPTAALPYLTGMTMRVGESKDLAISFVVPMHPGLYKRLSRDGQDPVGVELGTLIQELSVYDLSSVG